MPNRSLYAVEIFCDLWVSLWALAHPTVLSYWESLDADLGVSQLVSGVFGSKTWMTELCRSGGHSQLLARAI
jgi:hypothetical protein